MFLIIYHIEGRPYSSSVIAKVQIAPKLVLRYPLYVVHILSL